jgi:hypothetical protein
MDAGSSCPQVESEEYLIAKYTVKNSSNRNIFVLLSCPKPEFIVLMINLRRIALSLFAIWVVLVLMGKGGFVHLLLLNAIGVQFVDMIGVFRSRLIA